MSDSDSNDRVEFVRTLLAADPALTRRDLVARGTAFGMRIVPTDIWKARIALGLQTAPPRPTQEEPPEDRDETPAGAEEMEAPETAPEESGSAEGGDTRENRVAFVVRQLEADPEVSLEDLRERAAPLGLTINPQTLGAARRAAQTSAPGGARRRPRTAGTAGDLPASARTLLDLARDFESLRAEAERLRTAIARIRSVLADI